MKKPHPASDHYNTRQRFKFRQLLADRLASESRSREDAYSRYEASWAKIVARYPIYSARYENEYNAQMLLQRAKEEAERQAALYGSNPERKKLIAERNETMADRFVEKMALDPGQDKKTAYAEVAEEFGLQTFESAAKIINKILQSR